MKHGVSSYCFNRLMQRGMTTEEVVKSAKGFGYDEIEFSGHMSTSLFSIQLVEGPGFRRGFPV